MRYSNLIDCFSSTLDTNRNDLAAQINMKRSCAYGHAKGVFKPGGNFVEQAGLCRMEADGIDFSCLYIPGAEKTLHVAFSGARHPDHDYFTNPGISRWTYHKIFNGCLLGIDDPMYQKYPDIKLAWYYGDRNHFYLRSALKVVRHVAKLNGINAGDITFFSSSGGGYAALMASMMFPGTLSFSLNPQIFIGQWNYAEEFERITGTDLALPDPYHRNNPLPLLLNSRSHHLICINASSQEDVDTQLLPLVRSLGIRLRYGLNMAGRLLLWLYDAPGAPSAHTSFETRAIFAAMEEIAQAFRNSDKFDIDAWQPFALVINEIWHDLYQGKAENTDWSKPSSRVG